MAAAPQPLVLDPAPPEPSGQLAAYTNAQGEVSMRDSSGGYRWVPREQAQAAVSAGLIPESREEYESRRIAERYDAPLEAGLTSALRAGSLGLIDAISPDVTRQHARMLEEANPTATGIGNVLGTVASSLVPGAPLARVGQLGANIGGRGVATEIARRTLGRGIAEGAAIGGGAALSQGALADDVSVGDIAKGALAGAALGGMISLAGAGISAIGRKARSTAYKTAGVDELRLQLLQGREKALMDHLKVLRVTDPERAVLGEGALQSVQAEIHGARKAIFATAGKYLSAAAAPLGFVGGYSFDGLLLGMLGAGAGRVLAGAVGKKALGSAMDAGARVLGAVEQALPALGQACRTAGTRLLDEAAIETLGKRLALSDPGEIGQAALEGYTEAGLDPRLAQEAAGFQARRIELLRAALLSGGLDRIKASRLVNAAEDPRRIMRRLGRLEHTDEDLEALGKLLPRTAQELQLTAARLLEEGGLTAQQRSALEAIAVPQQHAAILAALHSPVPEQGEQMGRGTRRFDSPQAALPLQRIQGGRP